MKPTTKMDEGEIDKLLREAGFSPDEMEREEKEQLLEALRESTKHFESEEQSRQMQAAQDTSQHHQDENAQYLSSAKDEQIKAKMRKEDSSQEAGISARKKVREHWLVKQPTIDTARVPGQRQIMLTEPKPIDQQKGAGRMTRARKKVTATVSKAPDSPSDIFAEKNASFNVTEIDSEDSQRAKFAPKEPTEKTSPYFQNVKSRPPLRLSQEMPYSQSPETAELSEGMDDEESVASLHSVAIQASLTTSPGSEGNSDSLMDSDSTPVIGDSGKVPVESAAPTREAYQTFRIQKPVIEPDEIVDNPSKEDQDSESLSQDLFSDGGKLEKSTPEFQLKESDDKEKGSDGETQPLTPRNAQGTEPFEPSSTEKGKLNDEDPWSAVKAWNIAKSSVKGFLKKGKDIILKSDERKRKRQLEPDEGNSPPAKRTHRGFDMFCTEDEISHVEPEKSSNSLQEIWKTRINKFQVYDPFPLFCPAGVHPEDYAMKMSAYFENYGIRLHQVRCLMPPQNWFNPCKGAIVCGRHQKDTLDVFKRKRRTQHAYATRQNTDSTEIKQSSSSSNSPLDFTDEVDREKNLAPAISSGKKPGHLLKSDSFVPGNTSKMKALRMRTEENTVETDVFDIWGTTDDFDIQPEPQPASQGTSDKSFPYLSSLKSCTEGTDQNSQLPSQVSSSYPPPAQVNSYDSDADNEELPSQAGNLQNDELFDELMSYVKHPRKSSKVEVKPEHLKPEFADIGLFEDIPSSVKRTPPAKRRRKKQPVVKKETDVYDIDNDNDSDFEYKPGSHGKSTKAKKTPQKRGPQSSGNRRKKATKVLKDAIAQDENTPPTLNKKRGLAKKLPKKQTPGYDNAPVIIDSDDEPITKELQDSSSRQPSRSSSNQSSQENVTETTHEHGRTGAAASSKHDKVLHKVDSDDLSTGLLQRTVGKLQTNIGTACKKGTAKPEDSDKSSEDHSSVQGEENRHGRGGGNRSRKKTESRGTKVQTEQNDLDQGEQTMETRLTRNAGQTQATRVLPPILNVAVVHSTVSDKEPSQEAKISCPMCNKEFLEEEINDHAWQCDQDETVTKKTSGGKETAEVLPDFVALMSPVVKVKPLDKRPASRTPGANTDPTAQAGNRPEAQKTERRRRNDPEDRNIPSTSTSRETEEQALQNIETIVRTPCPLCSELVPKDNLEEHVQDCLDLQEEVEKKKALASLPKKTRSRRRKHPSGDSVDSDFDENQPILPSKRRA